MSSDRYKQSLCKSRAAIVNRWLLLSALAALTASCSTTSTTSGLTVEGKVTKVHDGDSIHITPAGGKRVVIRFSAIDAPEITQSSGIAAKDYLRARLLGRDATAQCHKTDRYQRNVCDVYVRDQDIGLAMINNGHAWHYKQYQHEQDSNQRKKYSRAENKARESRRGLWREDKPVAPWIFRNSQ